jgi:trimethylamine:corrinoid methyltransferase-like protein
MSGPGKSSPEFRERMAQVLQHVEEFKPTELALVATAQAGATRSVALAGTA